VHLVGYYKSNEHVIYFGVVLIEQKSFVVKYYGKGLCVVNKGYN